MTRVLPILLLASTAAAQQTPAPPPPSTDIWLVRWSPRPDRARNLTDRDGYDNQPSFDPASGTVYYTSWREGQTDIWVQVISTGENRQITRTAESEYSPTVMPDGTAFSTVRVEASGAQRLWAFLLDGTSPVPLLEDVRPVGYHAWLEPTLVAVYVLGTPATLQLADTRRGTTDTIASAVGRSLHRVPDPKRRALAWLDQRDSTRRVIRVRDLDTGEVEELAPALEGQEFFAFRPNGSLLMAQGPVLYEWNRGRKRWDARADFSSRGISSISRLAVSPDGRWLAFVADRSPASD